MLQRSYLTKKCKYFALQRHLLLEALPNKCFRGRYKYNISIIYSTTASLPLILMTREAANQR